MNLNQSMEVMLNSFNKAINDAIFSVIYDCKGVGIGTIDILKDKKNSDNISKLQLEQELYLLQQCGLSKGFNDQLYNSLYITIYEQIILLNQSSKLQLKTTKIKNIGPVIKYQLNNVITHKDLSQIISQAVYKIIDIIKNSNDQQLTDVLINNIANIMQITFNNFTNQIDIVNNIRNELSSHYLTTNKTKEGFASIFNGIGCKRTYIWLLFIVIVLYVIIKKNYHIESIIS